MTLKSILLSLPLTCLGLAPALAADFHFCWVGGNGYTMTGRITIPDARMSDAIVTETDITAFKISGYQEGTLLGTWSHTQAAPNTTWHLRFDPITMTFLTGDRFATMRSQGWNANGQVQDCGNPGFGFNAGSYAQDICVNGRYIAESSIAPDTPLFVSQSAVTPTCNDALLFSKSPIE